MASSLSDEHSDVKIQAGSPSGRGVGIVRAKRIVRNARSLEGVPGVAGPAKSLAGFSANCGPDGGDTTRMLLLALRAPNTLPPPPGEPGAAKEKTRKTKKRRKSAGGCVFISPCIRDSGRRCLLFSARVTGVKEALVFFIWLGASLFPRGAGLFRPASLGKRCSNEAKWKKSALP